MKELKNKFLTKGYKMQVNTDGITISKIKNCGAWCKKCKKQNIFYSILNGWYIYYCLNCKQWTNFRGVYDKKEN